MTRQLGIVTEIMEAVGLTVTYAYDDLVFVDNNPFLIRFDDDDETHIFVFFNKDCESGAAKELERQLKAAAAEQKMTLTNSGQYELKPKAESEEIEIIFIKS